MPQFPELANEPNIFNEQQEMWLGEIMAPDSDLPAGLQQMLNPRSTQMGNLLIDVERQRKGKNLGENYILTVSDLLTKKKLWERVAPKERPSLFYSKSGNTLTMVIGNYDNIKAEAKQDASLAARLSRIEGKEGKKDSYAIRVFDAVTGNNLGAILVDTGNLSFKVRRATAAGDTVLVSDSHDRTLVYSLKSGEQKGKVFGFGRAISPDGSKILVDNGKGEADIYETSALQSLGHLIFPARVTHAEFSRDGNTLLVLTADQNVYRLKCPQPLQRAGVH